MENLSNEILDYCQQHSSEESEVLKQVVRNTHLYLLQPRMLSGHFQGVFLEFISKMISPNRILEIGTYSAYSCICLAGGLKEGGMLITIEKNPELDYLIKKHIDLAKLSNKITNLIGDAADIIPTLDEVFDVVFIDADKENYLKYFDMVFPKLRSGGLIIADNVLWDSKVLNPDKWNDNDTLGIIKFNESIANNPDVEVIVLPFRDGLSLIRKK